MARSGCLMKSRHCHGKLCAMGTSPARKTSWRAVLLRTRMTSKLAKFRGCLILGDAIVSISSIPRFYPWNRISLFPRLQRSCTQNGGTVPSLKMHHLRFLSTTQALHTKNASNLGTWIFPWSIFPENSTLFHQNYAHLFSILSISMAINYHCC